MAETKEKTESLDYSSEELAEIERIVGILPGSSVESADGDLISLQDDDSVEAEEEPLQEVPDISDSLDLPNDIQLDDDLTRELDTFTLPDDAVTPLNDDDDQIPIVDDSINDEPALPSENIPELDDDDLSFDEIDDIDFPDITDNITEIHETPEEELSFDELGGDDALVDFGEEELPEGDDDFGAGFDLPSIDDGNDETTSDLPDDDDDSMMDQLNELTADDGESVDFDEIIDDAFIDDSIGDVPDLNVNDSVDLSGDDDLDGIESLDDLDISEDEGFLEEGGLADLPAADLADFESDEAVSKTPATDDFTDTELDIGTDDFDSAEEDAVDISSELNDFDDSQFAELSDLDSVGDSADIPEDAFDSDSGELSDLMSDTPEIVPVDDFTDDGEAPMAASSPAGANKSLDLSEDELKKIKKALMLYPAGLTDAIKDTILNDRLPARDIRIIIDLILNGRPEHNVRRALEKKLGTKIGSGEHASAGRRRILMSRSEYSTEGRERQKILLRRTRNAAIAAVVVAVLGVVSYRKIYIPYKAQSIIATGTALIHRHNEPKLPDYKEAEQLFDKVDKEYIADYIYAYNEYARAYFDRKQYMRSLLKLNKAYLLVDDNFTSDHSITLLNNLGYFYSMKKGDTFPDFFQKSIKLNMNEWYFTKLSALGEISTQYDLAIDFYKKVLSRDMKNLDALLGIGDVYMNQGQYLKARAYYENILKIDSDSVAGHSGLFNLFIERDNFPEVVSVYVKLRDKDMLVELPSALLAKSADYLLSKSKSDTQNIRIDHGIQSPRLKDSDDQPFPMIVDVLKALRKKNPDYPPLYIAYAKLSIKQGNFKLAKEYLENGLKRSESAGLSFFAGKHMLGEYYYFIKQPSKAFKFFKDAIKDYKSPPDYAFHPYYRETEKIGKTYTMLGNIFYYFFDKVKYRTGDQEMMTDMDLRHNEELMGNFNIAREYYEEALASNYESPELHYNLGRVYYLNGEYMRSRDQWLNLYDEFTVSPELMLGLGNVFYKLGNYDAAKSQFIKLTSVYEYEAGKIAQVLSDNKDHQKVFQSLSAAYNNLGAVYQQQNVLEQSAICYWNSVELSRKVGEESEFARVNLGRGVKERTTPVEPILDDNIPYSISYFRESMRWKR